MSDATSNDMVLKPELGVGADSGDRASAGVSAIILWI